jgi:hypothetical protein
MKKITWLFLLTVAMVTGCGDSAEVATSDPVAAAAPDMGSQSDTFETPLSCQVWSRQLYRFKRRRFMR